MNNSYFISSSLKKFSLIFTPIFKMFGISNSSLEFQFSSWSQFSSAEELPTAFLIVQTCYGKMLLVLFDLKMSLFPFHVWRIVSLYRILNYNCFCCCCFGLFFILFLFFFQHCKDSPLFSGLPRLWKEVRNCSSHCPLTFMACNAPFFSSHIFFSLSLVFSNLIMMCVGISSCLELAWFLDFVNLCHFSKVWTLKTDSSKLSRVQVANMEGIL